MNRLRVTATIDWSAVSPDSVRAALDYAVSALEEQALGNRDKYGDPAPLAIDWNSLHVFTKARRWKPTTVVAWAKVAAV